MTDRGLIVAAHDNRPLELDPSRFGELAGGWLWAHRGRFSPAIRLIKESLDAGKLGAPGLVRIHDWRSSAGEDVSIALLGQLDLACWLNGTSPTVVYAQSPADPGAYVQVHLGFPGDAMAVIDCAARKSVGRLLLAERDRRGGRRPRRRPLQRQLQFSPKEEPRAWIAGAKPISRSLPP